MLLVQTWHGCQTSWIVAGLSSAKWKRTWTIPCLNFPVHTSDLRGQSAPLLYALYVGKAPLHAASQTSNFDTQIKLLDAYCLILKCTIYAGCVITSSQQGMVVTTRDLSSQNEVLIYCTGGQSTAACCSTDRQLGHTDQAAGCWRSQGSQRQGNSPISQTSDLRHSISDLLTCDLTGPHMLLFSFGATKGLMLVS